MCSDSSASTLFFLLDFHPGELIIICNPAATGNKWNQIVRQFIFNIAMSLNWIIHYTDIVVLSTVLWSQHLHYLSTRLCPWSFRRHEWVRQVVPQCWYYHWHGFLEKIELHKSCPDSEIDLQLTIASGKSLTTELSRVIVEILNQHWAV